VGRKAFCIIALLLVTFVAPSPPAGGGVGCDAGPVDAPTSDSVNLDTPASRWGTYCEGSPIGSMENVSEPSLDGQSLRLSLTGGAPYSNLHFYETNLPQPEVSLFKLSLWFRMEPATTCANVGGPSVVQQIEFTDSLWAGGSRWEAAVAYRNVGEGAPGWRYWDPHASGDRWVALEPSPTQCLAANEWHYLQLVSRIVAGQLRYERLIVDSIAVPLDRAVAPAEAPGEPDRLGMAIQLDGNSSESPYNVYVDRVSFIRKK
jgi:hypothetical protein